MISSSIVVLQRIALSSGLMREGMLERKSAVSSSLLWAPSLYKFLKWVSAATLTWLKPLQTWPSTVLISAIWFLDNLSLYCQWKKEVFLSPAFNQRLLDFSLHYSSSFWKDWYVDHYSFISFSSNSVMMSLLSISVCKVCSDCTASLLFSVGVGAGFFIHSLRACFVAFNFCSHT